MKLCFFLLLAISQADPFSASSSPFYKLNVSGQVYLVSKSWDNYKTEDNVCTNHRLELATIQSYDELQHLTQKLIELKQYYRFFKWYTFWIRLFWDQKILKCGHSHGPCCPGISSNGLNYSPCSYWRPFMCTCESNCTEIYSQIPNEITESNCSCALGLVPASDDNCTCVDEDECENDVCDQNCTNTFGSYICGCSDGFRLNASDNSTCEDIDECLENSTLCKHHCYNFPGSYLCYCPLGYKLAEDGWSCQKSPRFKSCACYCSRDNTYNISERLAMAKTSLETENKTEAIRYKKSLSSFRRAVTCAKDERKEASAVGSLGIVLIVLCGCAIVGPDVVSAIFFVVKKFAKSE